jgi:hypothetical protein
MEKKNRQTRSGKQALHHNRFMPREAKPEEGKSKKVKGKRKPAFI